MNIYIQAISSISPQKTFGQLPFLTEPVVYSGNRLTAIEPDYGAFIDVKSIRRMSRIIRMGVAAASDSLRVAASGLREDGSAQGEAGKIMPDAIITGTAFGCLADTGIFLTRIIEQDEQMLSPTAFIQSTHNTVGGQIALMLQCHGYNNTFVHRGFSFESALLDAMLLLEERDAGKVLVGSVDEITDVSHAIFTRLGFYKPASFSSADLFTTSSKGTIAGEGAAFFLLAGEPSPGSYAKLDAISTLYKPRDTGEVERHIQSFLTEHSIDIRDIDLVISGNNGDNGGDHIYQQLKQSVFSDSQLIHYKDLCGEYPTSTSFALWLAANIIKTGELPAAMRHEGDQRNAIRRILIYNHYQQIHHSLILVSAVDQ
jgi:3-oxoacyl-[acyl-carrier-protein] synthase II